MKNHTLSSNNTYRFALAWLCICLSFTAQVSAGEWDFGGYVGVQSRYFWQTPAFPGQLDGFQSLITVQPELRWSSEDRQQRLSLILNARRDSADSNRDEFDISEAYWALERDTWDLTIGYNKVFWGVTESRHLVDIINQTDLVADLDQESKFGQQMLILNLQRLWGRLGLFILPGFQERSFAGVRGRLRPPLPINGGKAEFESANGNSHVDFALRYSHYFGDLDVGASLFTGTSREPRILPSPRADFLTPYYDQITQFGVDIQYTKDAWLWKLEAIARQTQNDRFAAFVAGFEYTFYGIGQSASDIGLLLEFIYDGRAESEPPVLLDKEIFLGSRLALNDASDTSLLAGLAVDLRSQAMFFSIEAERRLTDSLSTELKLRVFANASSGELADAIEKDDHLQLQLNWHF